jgi:hypothetical protein
MGAPRSHSPHLRTRLGVLSGVIMLTLLIWAALLFRMVASSPAATSGHQGPPPCSSTPRVLWAPQVVLRAETAAAAVHINEVGHIVAAWPCRKDEAEDYAEVRGLPLEAWDHDEVISPGIVDAAAHLAEWLEPGGRSYEGFTSGTAAAAAGGVTTVRARQPRPPAASAGRVRQPLCQPRASGHNHASPAA